MAEKPTEQEFVDQYAGYVAKHCARSLYRALYPIGMHTNGPTIVPVEASHLMRLLESHKQSSQGKGESQ